MLTTRQRLAAACLLVATALFMTACSSDVSSGSDSDNIEGADSGESNSASPSASAAAEKNAPAFDFPSDIKVTVERQPTGDATKDEILRDVAYASQAQLEAFTEGNGQTANMNRYFAANARTYWADRVTTLKKDGLTVTGDYRFFNFEVTDVTNDNAAVRYCEDQSKAYGKEIKTDKVLRTQPSDKDFILYTLQAAKDSAGDWQVTQQSWKKGDASCVRG
ncbi:hypothetical protein AB0H92_31400 [Streptomyces phaeochromogenes]|uniref:hypothetical protein n=1 Tax=Streptomyces phaeochromogenes TaxID=1923 RepID=UPI0033D92E4F